MIDETLSLDNIAIDGAGWPIALPTFLDRERRRARDFPRVLLVDDDPIFCKRMARAARQNHIPLSTCGSIQEMEAIRQYSAYDVALIDYYLGDRTAPEIIPMFKGRTPVILISEDGSADLADAPWPDPVKRFVSKSKGMKVILEEALRVINLDSIRGKVSIERAPDTSLSYSEWLWALGAAFVCFACSVFVFSVFGLLDTPPVVYKAMPDQPNPAHDFKPNPIPKRSRSPIKWDQAPIDKTRALGSNVSHKWFRSEAEAKWPGSRTHKGAPASGLIGRRGRRPRRTKSPAISTGRSRKHF